MVRNRAYRSQRPKIPGSNAARYAPKKIQSYDIRKLESSKMVDVQQRNIAGQTVHVDKNDPRPHVIHKRTENGRTTYHKSVFSSLHDLYAHHLENADKRAHLREDRARADYAESRAKLKKRELGDEVIYVKSVEADNDVPIDR